MERLEQVKKDFVKLARMTQPELKRHMRQELQAAGYDVIEGDGYLYGRGGLVLLTAHLDTVHAEPVRKVYRQTTAEDIIVSSPQGIGGDDRAGCWCLLEAVRRLLPAGIRPAVLLCEDEEIGGVGSDKFCRTEHVQELEALIFLVELDRANRNDAVYYDDDNEEFRAYIERVIGYHEARGSFSDISNLCPVCGRSGVNLSVGYYEAHRLTEHVSMREMARTADAVVELVQHTAQERPEPFEYMDAYVYERSFDGWGWPECEARITFVENGLTKSAIYTGDSLEACIGRWCMEHPQLTFDHVQEALEL